MAGCAAFFLLYGVHAAYEDEWLIPTLILIVACALAWVAKWAIDRKKAHHD